MKGRRVLIPKRVSQISTGPLHARGRGQAETQAVVRVDYRKAYDSFPHDWLRVMLEAIKMPKQIRRYIDAVMSEGY